MEISNTRLETYLDCPQRYKLLYMDRIHEEPRVELEFGKLVHEVLRFVHDPANSSTPAFDEITAVYEKGWSALPDIEGLPEYRPLGLSMLRNYCSAHLPLNEEVLAVEQSFRLPLEDHMLKGVMDRVGRGRDGALTVTDYKTSRRLPTQPDIERSKQAIIYHHSAQKLYPGHPVSVKLHFLKFDFIFETVPTEDAWLEVKSEIMRAVYGIESGHFTPKPGWVCEYCGYTALCPAMRHIFEAGKGETELPDGTDIDDAVREYVELKETIKSSRIKIEELSERIRSYMDSKGFTRLFVDDVVLSRVRSRRQEWDEEKLAQVLARLGLLKDVLGIRLEKLKSLAESGSLTPEQRIEIESCRNSRQLDMLRYKFVDEDTD